MPRRFYFWRPLTFVRSQAWHNKHVFDFCNQCRFAKHYERPGSCLRLDFNGPATGDQAVFNFKNRLHMYLDDHEKDVSGSISSSRHQVYSAQVETLLLAHQVTNVGPYATLTSRHRPSAKSAETGINPCPSIYSPVSPTSIRSITNL